MWDYIYTYDITVNFPNGLDLSLFIQQVTDSSINKQFLAECYSGSLFVYFSEELTAGEKTTLDNIVSSHQAPVNSGSSYEKYVDDTMVSSTTSGTYQQKIRLTTEYIEEGTYEIKWSYNWRCNRKSSTIDIKVELDDTTIIGQQIEENLSVNASNINNIYNFKNIYINRGIHTIDIDFKTSSNSTVYIWDTKLSIKKYIN